MDPTERRLLALEKIVEFLLSRSSYEKKPCSSDNCFNGDGLWQDGSPCSYCGGAGFTLVPQGLQMLEKGGDHQQGGP